MSDLKQTEVSELERDFDYEQLTQVAALDEVAKTDLDSEDHFLFKLGFIRGAKWEHSRKIPPQEPETPVLGGEEKHEMQKKYALWLTQRLIDALDAVRSDHEVEMVHSADTIIIVSELHALLKEGTLRLKFISETSPAASPQQGEE